MTPSALCVIVSPCQVWIEERPIQRPAEAIVSVDVEFQPLGRRAPCPEERTLLEHAREVGLSLVGLCGGQGTCGRCRVQVLKGKLSPPTSSEQEHLSREELERGMRLACQAYPQTDASLTVPPESMSSAQRAQVEGQDVRVSLDPVVRSYDVTVEPPSLQNLSSDTERLRLALTRRAGAEVLDFDTEVLRTLSPMLRAHEWKLRAYLRAGECIALRPADVQSLGLAFDLGTTKVAGYLLDLDTGQTLASKGVMNPQIGYGEDVVARLARALWSADETSRLQRLAIEALGGLTVDLTAQAGGETMDVVEALVVGNTAMHHLLLRLPVQQLALAPYVPVVARPLDIKARDLGLQLASGAYVHLLPNIAGYIGSDHVALILGTGLGKAKDTILALDIGTNTEICLAHRGQLSSVSCASGPAFEGAHITHGMRAASGAIEHLRLVDDGVEYQTVDSAAPVGLCGSGVVDALAELHAAGVIDPSGRILEHPRVRSQDNERFFVLVDEGDREGQPAITITQRDVRELQLAKGAIQTGIQALLKRQNLSDQDLDRVIIAGAFGTYINLASAITIGLLPALPLDRFRQVGNAAGTGARMALLSRTERKRASEIAQRVRYFELATLPEFAELFAGSTRLGEYHITNT